MMDFNKTNLMLCYICVCIFYMDLMKVRHFQLRTCDIMTQLGVDLCDS